MSKATGLLSRLVGRREPAPVVSALAFAVLNRPLLAHPAMAESLIRGYLTGTITSDDTMLSVERVPLQVAGDQGVTTVGTIGVLPITGGLVNRPMPGASGPGPMSYVALRQEFDDLLADDAVTAIVLRIESPGGMASGCFDLVDHLYACRGAKPMVALIDDYAFSAAYAIASACDEIWVSRTGGAGSVGVCSSHEDWSAYNEKIGVKVTEMFAGARKMDYSPDAALSDEAKANWQQWINDDYDMFVGIVARNRGMTEEQVRATEAAIFFGQRSIAAGLADRLGVWDDLVAELAAGGTAAPDQAVLDPEAVYAMRADAGTGQPRTAVEGVGLTGDGTGEPLPQIEGEQGATAEGVEQAAADSDEAPAEVEAAVEADAKKLELAVDLELPASTRLAMARDAMVTLAAGANLPAPVALALIESVGMEDEPATRLKHARQVIDLCAAAGAGADPVPYVRSNTDIAQVRAALVEAKAKADEAVQLQTTLPANAAEKPKPANRLDPSAIYRNRGK